MFKDTKRVAIIRQSEKHRLYNGQKKNVDRRTNNDAKQKQ